MVLGPTTHVNCNQAFLPSEQAGSDWAACHFFPDARRRAQSRKNCADAVFLCAPSSSWHHSFILFQISGEPLLSMPKCLTAVAYSVWVCSAPMRNRTPADVMATVSDATQYGKEHAFSACICYVLHTQCLHQQGLWDNWIACHLEQLQYKSCPPSAVQ